MTKILPDNRGKKYDMILQPRQIRFLESYLDVESETFGNVYRSALRAGYDEKYAQNISGQMPNWLSENLDDSKMLKKAENNIIEMLDIKKTSPSYLRIKADITKFVAERVGKKKYSLKLGVEHSGTIKLNDILDEIDE